MKVRQCEHDMTHSAEMLIWYVAVVLQYRNIHDMCDIKNLNILYCDK